MKGIRFEGVTYAYPGAESPAVKNITLSVAPGEAKLVTGASGCGKSTLMRLANGMAPQILGGVRTGRIEVEGLDPAAASLAELSERVGTLFQDPEAQFFALTVGDEIAFALKSRGLPAEEVRARTLDAARRTGVEHLLEQDIHALSEGQKQKTGLAAILALGPKAIVLDEPSANLDPEAAESLASVLLELKREGTAILIVDHRLYWLKGVVDEALVMSAGEIVARGPFDAVFSAEARRAWGLRRPEVNDPRPRLPRIAVRRGIKAQAEASSGEARFSAEGLAFAYPGGRPIFDGVSFAAPAGITALIGPNGAGKTTLAKLLTGLLQGEGRFCAAGRPVGREGLLPQAGLVLQNADHQLQMRTVMDEVLAAILAAEAGRRRREPRRGFARLFGRLFPPRLRAQPSEAERARAAALLASLGLERLAGRHPQSLSGGEKQRLVIGCALAKDPDVLILDEPTSGLDGANLAAIASILEAESQKGRAVFLITHDLELLSRCGAALDMADMTGAAGFAGPPPAAS